MSPSERSDRELVPFPKDQGFPVDPSKRCPECRDTWRDHTYITVGRDLALRCP